MCLMTAHQVVERGYSEVMVLEDDIRFEPFFRQKVSHMMAEMRQLQLDWDLVWVAYTNWCLLKPLISGMWRCVVWYPAN